MADPADLSNHQLVESAVKRITEGIANFVLEEVVAEAIDGYWRNFMKHERDSRNLSMTLVRNSLFAKMTQQTFRYLASAVKTSVVHGTRTILMQCSCFKMKQERLSTSSSISPAAASDAVAAA